jgi:hypothetical protein
MIDPAEFDTKGLPLTARAVCLIFFHLFAQDFSSIFRFFLLDLIKK